MRELIHEIAGLVRAGIVGWHETARLSVLLLVLAGTAVAVLLVLQ